MMMMMGRWLLSRKERELGILCKAGARGRERRGEERTVTTLARFASGKRK
jgi:hypothetical protein